MAINSLLAPAYQPAHRTAPIRRSTKWIFI